MWLAAADYQIIGDNDGICSSHGECNYKKYKKPIFTFRLFGSVYNIGHSKIYKCVKCGDLYYPPPPKCGPIHIPLRPRKKR